MRLSGSGCHYILTIFPRVVSIYYSTNHSISSNGHTTSLKEGTAMEREQDTPKEKRLSDKTETEQANIRMDREFYGDSQIEHPEEVTVPFVNRNQS